MCTVHTCTCALYTNVHVHFPDEESYMYICNKLETAVQVLLVCLVPLWATLYMYMYNVCICTCTYMYMFIVVAVLHGHCNYYVGSIVISVL